jgi:hypothetical protein
MPWAVIFLEYFLFPAPQPAAPDEEALASIV